MWYDEIGLFKPASINPETDTAAITIIKAPFWKQSSCSGNWTVSIQEIHDFMKNRSAASLKSLMEDKIADLNLRIAHLQAVRTTLCTHHRNMSTLLTMDLSEISIVERKERSLVTVDIHRETSFEEKVELITAETENIN